MTTPGRKIDSVRDYVSAIGALNAGVATKIVVERAGKRMTFTIVIPVPQE